MVSKKSKNSGFQFCIQGYSLSKILSLFFIIISLLLSLSVNAYALDIEAILDSSDGTSAFEVKDAASTDALTVNSEGQMVVGHAAAVDGTEMLKIQNVGGDFSIFVYSGVCEANVIAEIGDMCINEASGLVYIKRADGGAATGWRETAVKIPAVTATEDLGSAAIAWSNIYVRAIQTDAGQNLTLNSAGGTIDIDDDILDLSTQTMDVTLNNAVDALNVDTNTLTVDALNNRVGFGDAAPLATAHVGLGGALTNIDGTNDLFVSGDIESDGTVFATVINAGTIVGTIDASLTPGSVTFGDATGALDEDNANFFYNDTNDYLGIGTATPGAKLEIEVEAAENQPAVLIDSARVDQIALNITSGQTTADVINVSASAVTTGVVFDVSDADALVTGSIASFTSNSADASARTLVQITNDNAASAGATVLGIQQDGAEYAVDVNATADEDVVRIQASNATFASDALHIQSAEEDDGAFNFIKLTSDSDGAPDDELTISQDGTITTDGDLIVSGSSTLSGPLLDISNQTVDVSLNNAVDALNIDTNTLSVDAQNNRVGVGVAAPVAALHVGTGGAAGLADGDGDVYIQNDLEVDGDVWLGDASVDNITINGELVYNASIDLNGNRLTLDADGDTYLEADTDDQVDLTIDGVDEITITKDQLDITGSQIINVGTIDSGAVALEITGTTEVVVNEDSEDVDLRVETNNQDDMLVIDASTDRIGINTSAPAAGLTIGAGTNDYSPGIDDLYVTGNLEVDGSVWLGDAAVDNITINGEMVYNASIDLNGNRLTLDLDGDSYMEADTDDQLDISLGDVDEVTFTKDQIDVTGAQIVNVGTIDSGAVALEITGTTEVVVNEDSEDVDLRVETNNQDDMFVVDASTDRVGINTSTPQGGLTVGAGTNDYAQAIDDVYITGDLEVDGSVWLGDAAVDNITINGEMTYNASIDLNGNRLTLDIDGDSYIEADTDDQLDITLGDADEVTFTKDQIDVTGAQIVNVGTIDSGAVALEITGTTEVVVNEDSEDVDLRVETNNQDDMFVVDASTDRVGINTSTPQGGLTVGAGTNDYAQAIDDVYITGDLEVDGSVWLGDAAVDNITINGDMIYNSSIDLNGNRLTLDADGDTYIEADTDDQFEIALGGVDEVAFTKDQIDITGAQIVNVGTIDSGAVALEITGTTEVVVNEDSEDVDLRVETSNQDDMLVVDASTDRIGINTSAPAAGLTVGTGTNDYAAAIDDVYITGDLEVDGSVWLGDAAVDNITINGDMVYNSSIDLNGNRLTLDADGDSYIEADTDDQFDIALGDVDEVTFTKDQIDITGAQIVNVGTIDSGAVVLEITGTTEVVVNEDSEDVDLRVETNNQDDMLVVDASTDRIGINTNAPAAGLTVGAGTNNNAIGIDDLYVTGELEVDGSLWATDATLDNIQIGLSTDNTIDTAAGALIVDSATDEVVFTSGTLSFSDQTVDVNLNNAVDAFNFDGNTLSLDAQNNKVGIGTAAPAAGLTIGAGTNDNATGVDDLYVTGILEVDGSVWLGDAAVDNITINGDMTYNSSIDLNGNRLTLDVDGDTFVEADTDDQIDVAIGDVDEVTFTKDQIDITGAQIVNVGTIDSGAVALEITGTTEVVINEDSEDVDLRVETNNQDDMFVVDASTDRVGINTATPQGGLTVGAGTNDYAQAIDDVYITGDLEVDGSVWLGDAAVDNITINGDMVYNSSIDLNGNRLTLDVDGDTFIEADTDDQIDIALGAVDEVTFTKDQIDVTGAQIVNVGTIDSGAVALEITGTTEVVVNEDSEDVDLRVETNNQDDMFVVDASTDRVGINTSTPQGGLTVGAGTNDYAQAIDDVYITGDLEVDGSVWLGDAAVDNITINGDMVYNSSIDLNGNRLTLDVDGDTYIEADTDDQIDIALGDVDEVTFTKDQIDVTGAQIVNVGTVDGGTVSLELTGQTEVVVNEQSEDVDLRVETNNQDDMLVVDASTDRIGINTSAPAAGLTVGTGSNDYAGAIDDVYITGDLEVDGSVWLGDAAVDNITINGDMVYNSSIDMNGNRLTLDVDGDTFIEADTDDQLDIALGAVDEVTFTKDQIDVTGAQIVNVGTIDSGAVALEITGTTEVVVNEDSEDVDLRVETNNQDDMFVVDASTDRIGINTATPQGGLTVGAGTNDYAQAIDDVYITGDLEVDGSVWLGDAAVDNITINGDMVYNSSIDMNGNRLTLDVDGDTYIEADTDDQIDIALGDVDEVSFAKDQIDVTGAQIINIGTLEIDATTTTSSVIDLDATSVTTGNALGITVDASFADNATVVNVTATDATASNNLKLIEIDTEAADDLDVIAVNVTRAGGVSDASIYYDESDDLWYLNEGDGTDVAIATATSVGVTDGGTVTYITDVTDDFAVGGTDTSADFYFDQSEGDLFVNTGGISIQSDDQKLFLGAGDDASIYVDTNDDLFIANTTSDQDMSLVVNDGGTMANVLFVDGSEARIGVGTTAPSATLSIIDDSSVEGFNIKHSNLTQGVAIGYTSINKVSTNASSNLEIDAYTYGDLLLQATATGGVGIGMSSPVEKLQMTGSASFDGALLTSGSITIDSDSAALQLGDGQDASIYYDATNLVLNPSVVGTGNVLINQDQNAVALAVDAETTTANIIYVDGTTLTTGALLDTTVDDSFADSATIVNVTATDVTASNSIKFVEIDTEAADDLDVVAINVTRTGGVSDASIYYDETSDQWYLNQGDGINRSVSTGVSAGTTDAGSVTYVVGTTDDFAIGGTNSNADFFFDQSEGDFILNTGGISIQSDGEKLFLGAGDEASIYYDGSDLDLVATGTINFTDENLITDGTISIDGDNKQLYLGESQDAAIYYDGSDLDLVATGTINFTDENLITDGTISIDGDNKQLYLGESQDSSVYFDANDLILYPNDGATTAQVKIVQDQNVDALAIDSTATTADVIEIEGTTLTDGAILKATVDDTLSADATIIEVTATDVDDDMRLMEVATTPANEVDIYVTMIDKAGTGDDPSIYYDENDDVWMLDQGAGTPTQIATSVSGGAVTDGGAVTYVTGQTDDFAVGGTTSAADLFFDQSEGDLIVNTGGISIQSDSEKLFLGAGDDASIYVDSSDDLWIANTTSDQDINVVVNDGGTMRSAMFIDGSESRVGIGVTAPTNTLQLPSTGVYSNYWDSTTGTIGTSFVNARQMLDADNTSYYLDLDATGEGLILRGRAGVGTTLPVEKLQVSGSASFDGGLLLSGSTTLDADNAKVLLGASQDSSIYFDATDLIILPNDGATTAQVKIVQDQNVDALAIDTTATTSDVIEIEGTTLTDGAILKATVDDTLSADATIIEVTATDVDDDMRLMEIATTPANEADVYVTYIDKAGTGDDPSIYYDENDDAWMLDQGAGAPTQIATSVSGGAVTDGGAVTYVTGQTDDFAIGGTTSASDFFFDQSEGDLVVNTGGISIQSDDERLYFGASDDASIYYDSAETDLIVSTGSGSFIVLDGYVGIGTADPVEKLHVANGDILLNNTGALQGYLQGDSIARPIAYTSSTNYLWFGATGDTASTWNGINIGVNAAKVFVDTGNSRIDFSTVTAADPDMRLSSSGYLGVGELLPVEKLQVSGSASFDGGLLLSGSTTLDADNAKVLLGASQDSSIYFDATDLIILPNDGATTAQVKIVQDQNVDALAIDSTATTADVIEIEGTTLTDGAILKATVDDTLSADATIIEVTATDVDDDMRLIEIATTPANEADVYVTYIDKAGTGDDPSIYYDENDDVWMMDHGAGSPLQIATSTSGGATTDGGAVTYVTGQTDDFAIGGTTSASDFFFDQSEGHLTVNTGGISIQSDDQRLYLGTADDASIYVDSSDDLWITSATSDQDISLVVNDGGTMTNMMFFDGSSGYLGIGTTTPATPIDVYTGATQRFTIAPDGETYFYIDDASSDEFNVIYAGNNVMAAGASTLTLNTWSATNPYTVTTGGNATSLTIQNAGANPLIFGTNSTERARFDSAGHFGVGDTLPVEKLQVSGSASFDGGLLLSGSVTVNADNQSILFGAAQDASIYYDGSDLDLIATGTINFTDENLITDGTISIDGDSKQLYFGESQDAAIYYDGNDLDLIATGTINFTDENLITDGSISIDADDSRLYFGESQDASIYYDSTESDMVIATGSRSLIITGTHVGINVADPGEELEVNNTIVYSSEYSAGTSNPFTIDWGNGNKQVITLDNDNSTVNFTNPNGGIGNFLLRIIQDGTGGRNVASWDADIRWPGGNAPTLSSGAADIDIVSCYYSGTEYYCTPSFDFQ